MINIDTGLNKSYRAEKGVQTSFEPIPDGIYKLRVKEVAPWKAETKNIKYLVKDENGKQLMDEKGNKITEMLNNCTFYNCNVKLEVIGGEYDGRIIFHNLTTHPNMNWSVSNFLYGIGLDGVPAGQVQNVSVGRICDAEICTNSYDKKVQDKDTGMDKIEKKYVNNVKSFKQYTSQNPNTTDMNIGQQVSIEDMGI